MRTPKPKTIFDDNEPVSKEEMKEYYEKLHKEWFKKNIGGIIVLAAHEGGLENLLIERIGYHEKLRKSLMERLPKLRKVGAPKKWSKDLYALLVMQYAILYEQAIEVGRTDRSEYAFEVLTDRWGYKKNSVYLKECLGKARKQLNEDDVPEWAVPYLKLPKKQPAKK